MLSRMYRLDSRARSSEANRGLALVLVRSGPSVQGQVGGDLDAGRVQGALEPRHDVPVGSRVQKGRREILPRRQLDVSVAKIRHQARQLQQRSPSYGTCTDRAQASQCFLSYEWPAWSPCRVASRAARRTSIPPDPPQGSFTGGSVPLPVALPSTRERTFQRIAGSGDTSNASTMDSYTARLCQRGARRPAECSSIPAGTR
jgi:hypothetical protein